MCPKGHYSDVELQPPDVGRSVWHREGTNARSTRGMARPPYVLVSSLLTGSCACGACTTRVLSPHS